MAKVYLYANIKLKYGKLQEFSETMEKLVPIFEDQGWKLIGAWSTVIGDLNEVHDIWELEDANAVGGAMGGAMTNPSFLAVAPELADQIETEVITVVTKVSYSP
jgi:hypothetical protein